ncbi:MAG TPA: hypothetical protein VGF63_09705 [Solirubrobacteraceae bacterium]|jgi:hypothetical protein
MSEDHDRTEELRELARYARQRRDLYRARTYGPRETSATRLRELERASDAAQTRLEAYVTQRALEAGSA